MYQDFGFDDFGFDRSERNRERKRLTNQQHHIIYQFTSPSGEHCYIGITAKSLEQRIAEHCNDEESALFIHLTEFRGRPSLARKYFEEIGIAYGYRLAEEAESKLIMEALLFASLDGSKPVPINRMTHEIHPYNFAIQKKTFLQSRQQSVYLLEEARRLNAKNAKAQERLEPVIRRYFEANRKNNVEEMKNALEEMRVFIVENHKRRESRESLIQKAIIVLIAIIILLGIRFSYNGSSCDCDSFNNWCCND